MIRNAILLAVVGVAAAAPSASRALTLGLDDAGPLGSPDAQVQAPWIQRAVNEHATLVRVDIQWSAVAPATLPSSGFDQSDPGSRYYSWQQFDSIIRALTARGLSILIVITGAPSWAEGAHPPAGALPGTWKPRAQDFARFARAAALRYSGRYPDPQQAGHDLPRVRLWEAWNEPNLSEYLTPQWTRGQDHRLHAVSPRIYRNLLNAFYAAVKRVSAANFVVGGATAPFGNLSPTPGNHARMPPVTFVEDLLCLRGGQKLRATRCPHPAHLDALDHHPYDIGGPLQHAVDPGDVSTPDMGKLTRLISAAHRAGTILPARRTPIWVTEIGWSSRPPRVSLERQAQWVQEGIYVLWHEGISLVCWLQLADDPPGTGLTAGLYLADGRPKPAAVAFRFPFVVIPGSNQPVHLWGRSPLAGTVRIQRRAKHGWVTVKRVNVHRYGIFSATINLTGHPTLRAKIGSQASLSWAGA